MQRDTPTHRQFFGDAERDFALTPELIIELERVTGAGIGGLCKRLFASDFKHADLLEVVRLALIGGGETPEDAAALVAAYATTRPLAETFPLAVAILETLWFGRTQTGADDE
ncbi:MAG: gene transfer agent family protein [Rhodoblastus sp.]|nr:gene transfer agent family protein [Rhodoblastus sp.]MCB9999832.1 gene transfer agent family protein [Methylobacteriaceae bacterium]MCC2112424.1 gene transfer agent family protein [Hyphomicrobiales bacterium]